MKIKTYSECKFLDEIFSNVPNNTFSELLLASNNEIANWNHLFELIYHKSELSLFDCKKEDLVLKAKANPFYQKLINQSLTGATRLNFNSNLNPELIDWKQVPFGSLHYYRGSILSKPQNLLICNLDSWKDEIGSVSSAKSFQVSSVVGNNTFPGWQFLEKINLPCDAAIIFDRYVLKKPSDLDNNLFAILSNLIPKNGLNEFHLTIMAKKSECSDFLKTKNKIETFLNKNYNSKVKVGFVLADKDLPHDREILTNYYRISSGNSFNYYSPQNNIVVNTKLDFIPVLSTDYKNYVSKLNELYVFVQGIHETHGNKRNKIFDLLKYYK